MADRRWSDLSAAAATAVTAATALITGLGALTITGALGRVQRNHGVAFAAAVVAVIVGIALVAVVASARDAEGWVGWRRFGTVAGVVLAVGGTALGFVLAIFSAGQTERPTIEVDLNQRTLTLSGAVSAADMSSGDVLEVRVVALRRRGRTTRRTRLSTAVVGPDTDGNASQRLSVQLPNGRFDAVSVTASDSGQAESCGVRPQARNVDGGRACVTIPLLQRAPQPSVFATWERRIGAERVVVVKLRGRNLNAGSAPRRTVVLRVVGVRRKHMVTLYRAVIDPVDRGLTRRALHVGIPSGVQMVCVGVTRMRHRRMRCPIDGGYSGAVQLRTVSLARH
jgi:hypothetical protein